MASEAEFESMIHPVRTIPIIAPTMPKVGNLLLDDDGSVKDFGHAAEIRGLIDEAWKQQERGIANLGEIIKSVPTSVKAELGEDDSKRLEANFKSWKDVFRLYLPTFGIVGAIIGIVLTGCIML